DLLEPTCHRAHTPGELLIAGGQENDPHHDANGRDTPITLKFWQSRHCRSPVGGRGDECGSAPYSICRRRATHAPHHLITSSARASTEGGIVRPRVLAVLRLMTSSNLVGCSTGRSAGLAPFRILSTKVATRRYMSG